MSVSISLFTRGVSTTSAMLCLQTGQGFCTFLTRIVRPPPRSLTVAEPLKWLVMQARQNTCPQGVLTGFCRMCGFFFVLRWHVNCFFRRSNSELLLRVFPAEPYSFLLDGSRPEAQPHSSVTGSKYHAAEFPA